MLTQAIVTTDDVRAARRRLLWGVIVMVVLIVIAAALRLRNLGELALTADEGYQALAVQGVMQHGVPKLDTGYVYGRAPLFVYLQAMVAAMFGGISPMTLRCVAAIAGVLCIPVGYWLGRTLVSHRVGFILAVLLTFSTWHIEMSRYARFYTLLQLLFTLGIICFYLGFYRDRWRYRIGFVLVTATTMLFHDLGVMLGSLFLTVIPLRSLTWKRKLVYLLATVATGMWWVVQTKMVGRRLYAFADPMDWIVASIPSAPAGSRGWWTSIMNKVPDLTEMSSKYLLGIVDKPLVLSIMMVIPAIVTVALLLLIWRRRKPVRGVLALGMVAAGLNHELALVVILAVVDVAFCVRSHKDWREPIFWVGLVGGLATTGLWGVWMLFTGVAEDITGVIYRLTRFPDIGRYYLQWLLVGWPVLLVLGGGTWMVLGVKSLQEDQPDGAKRNWFIVAGLFVPVVSMSFLHWQFSEARYFFHLYPLMLLLYALCVQWALIHVDRWTRPRSVMVRSGAVAVCMIAALWISQDANPLAANAIANRSYTDTKNPYRALLNWPPHAGYHSDPQTTSAYVREHRGPEDRVICVGPPHMAALYRWYLGDLDAQIGRRDNYGQLVRFDDGRAGDPVTGGRLIDSPESLDDLLEAWQGRTIWLLSDHAVLAPEAGFLSQPLRDAVLQRFGKPIFIGRDGISYVARQEESGRL